MDLPDNEAHFSVGMGIVDGEREKLPALYGRRCSRADKAAPVL